LHRTLGDKGNSSSENLVGILGALQRKTDVRLAVTAK
jgi:hypothetical protein